MRKIKFAIILSLLAFMSITKSGEHVNMPMIFGLIISIGYIFSDDFYHFILPALALIGVCLIFLSFYKKKKKLILYGYILTYAMIIGLLSDEKVYVHFMKQWYFFMSTIVYISLSIYVLIMLFLECDLKIEKEYN